MLYGRRFLQVKRPNQQYQSTEGKVGQTNTITGSRCKQVAGNTLLAAATAAD